MLRQQKQKQNKEMDMNKRMRKRKKEPPTSLSLSYLIPQTLSFIQQGSFFSSTHDIHLPPLFRPPCHILSYSSQAINPLHLLTANHLHHSSSIFICHIHPSMHTLSHPLPSILHYYILCHPLFITISCILLLSLSMQTLS